MFRSPAAFALAAAIAVLLTAAPAAARTAGEESAQSPTPCRVAMQVERLSCDGPIGRYGYPVPPVSRAILFGPAWPMPLLSDAGAAGADTPPRPAPARRPPAFLRPVALH
jgi:hypothetical protein